MARKVYDVLIVGGGPAGAACAWKLVSAGLSCLIVDEATFPRQKPCAGWITPRVLTDLEIEPGEYPHSLTTYHRLYLRVRGIPLWLPGTQHAVRRVEFDGWLLERSGAEREVHRARDLAWNGHTYSVDGLYTSRFLVGAGGTHCPVYHTFFKEEYPREPAGRIVALEDEFAYDWRDGRCQLWFFERGLPGYAWYVPKRDGVVNIGVGAVEDGLEKQGKHIQDYWKMIVRKLEKKGLVTGHEYQPVGHVYYTRRGQSRGRKENAFLVGDALGLATVDMGEGIGPAIRSGLAAARAIMDGREYSLGDIPKTSFLPPFLEKWL